MKNFEDLETLAEQYRDAINKGDRMLRRLEETHDLRAYEGLAQEIEEQKEIVDRLRIKIHNNYGPLSKSASISRRSREGFVRQITRLSRA